MQTNIDPSSKQKVSQGTRESRKHTPKANMRGLYQRAIRESFLKLHPKVAVRNPVMFIVWVGTIVTLLVTINPNLFGTVQRPNLQRLNYKKIT